jgi:hypothetical protein
MASTYVNDLRLNEMATGDASGSWGTVTNTNLELIGEAFSYGTETIGDADSTLTIADGAADAARSFYLKITSSVDLTTTRIVTLGPNTVSKVWMIENATTGSQVITIKQGSGATINVPNGQVKMISTDGAGSGGAVLDLLVDVDLTGTTTLVNLDVSGTALVTGVLTTTAATVFNGGFTANADSTLGTDKKVQFRDAAIYINSSVDGQLDIVADTEIQIAATTVDLNGALDVSGTALVTGVLTTTAATVSNGGGQFNGAINVGVDDTGYDVKFFGATAGAYMLWDESADDLILGGAAGLSVNSTALVTGVLTANGGAVFNESGADVDFRVESATTANALFVEGSSGNVGIGASPIANLSVLGGTSNASDLATAYSLAAFNITPKSTSGYSLQFGSGPSDFPYIQMSAGGTASGNLLIQPYGGNVGIGTTSPDVNLSVFGSAAVGADVGGEISIGGFYDGSSKTSYGSIAGVNQNGTGNTSGQLLFKTRTNFGSLTERMRIDSSGGLITKPAAGGHAVFNEDGIDADFRVESDGNANMLFVDGGNDRVGIGTNSPAEALTVNGNIGISDGKIYNGAGSNSAGVSFPSSTVRIDGYSGITFHSSSTTVGSQTERMAIDSSGNVTINENSVDADFRVESDSNANALFVEGSTGKISMGTATTNAELYLSKTTAGEVVRADNSQDSWTGTTFYSVIFGTGNNNGTTGADKHFGGYAGGAMRYIVCGNGDVKNTNNSYGAYSDLKLKENIVDSGSQWDDIKALRVRKYSMKDEYSDVPTQIGVIAQELEAVGMGGLVTEGADLDVDNNDLGTTTKQVTYSVLYMKAVKALQEAMERIESLEARITALEL